VSHPLDEGPVCVTEDDDVRLGVEPCQTAGDAPIEHTAVRQSQMLRDHIQAFEAEAKQAWPVAVGHHDAPSGELQFDLGR
jgi:hypothetical protein